MFSGVVLSLNMCRKAQATDASKITSVPNTRPHDKPSQPPPPMRFFRKTSRPSQQMLSLLCRAPASDCAYESVLRSLYSPGWRAASLRTPPGSAPITACNDLWNEAWTAAVHPTLVGLVYERIGADGPGETHRDEPLLPADREDGVIAAGASGSGIDEEVHGLVGDGVWGPLREHDVHIIGPEDLLQRVEGQAGQFGLYEVRPVLHDGLELQVPVAALPPRDEMQHVGALCGPPVLPALATGEGDAQRGEHGEVRDLVPHAQQAREEVDLARDGRDGQQAGRADDEEREYCLVGEVGVDVGRLL